MTVSLDDYELLMNLRPGDLRISNVPAEAHGHDEHQLANELLSLRDALITQSGSMRGNRPWRDSLIESAFNFKELDLLRFFARLMNEKHDPAVLRVVFIHAQNHGVSTDSITSEIVEAYRLVTASDYREFNVMVTNATRPDSDRLIETVITDPVAGRKLIDFINERGNNPEALLEFIDSSKETPVPLTPGTL